MILLQVFDECNDQTDIGNNKAFNIGLSLVHDSFVS